MLAVGAAAAIAAAQTISGFGMNLILAPAAQLALPVAAAVRLVVGTSVPVSRAGSMARRWRQRPVP